MALSEIEKLERRYAENPQGLTFAPLAEVHRKNGEVQRALDLLGPGLSLHPDYIPASIVLGRCHLDLGDVHAAERAFLHVLALDGENVIALKALADISERLLKFEEAERWLQTLLSLDRSNDEAREQLLRVETSRRQAGVASSAEPESVNEPAAAAQGVAVPEAGSGAAAEPEPEPAPSFERPVAEPAVGWVSQSSEISEHPSLRLEDLEPSALTDSYEEPAGIQYQEVARYDDEVEPLDGLVGRDLDVPDEVGGEFDIETSEDIVLRSSGGSEFQVPDASLELFAGKSPERPPFEEDAPVPPAAESRSVQPAEVQGTEVAAEPEPVIAMPGAEAAVAMSEPEAVAMSEPDALAMPEPEPLAVLSEAPEVTAPTPQPERELEPEPALMAAEPAPEPTPAPEPVPAEPTAYPEAAPRRAYAADVTGGRPVAQFLKDILSSRPPAQSAAPPVRQSPAPSGGAPTRPAADALSLSSVFGEEEAPTAPPAMPAAGPGSGVSFDDFFGAPGAAPTQRGSRAPDPKNDDLDQFHAWLQNLKR